VRWEGEGITRCELAGEEWTPLESACWFPVDLLRKEGPLVVGRIRDGVRETGTVRVGAYPYRDQHIRLKDDKHVKLSKKDLARVQKEAREVAALFTRRTPTSFRLPLGSPLVGAGVPRNFGTRRVFNGEPRNPHNGADFAANAGTPVLAVAPGKVVLVANHFFAGRCVFIDHGDGLISMYFHLSRSDVSSGAAVMKGQKLGSVGSTGRASGPHLHFGLRWRGARIDPNVLLSDPEDAPRIDGR
jgi:murein DD-endopeptidase MepM/ murein hydrolase activator NlpD